ncbi:MAG: YceI family protein [Phycisphaerales bacterium]|nr:YceI family protein [Phycisphaerales bacterium]
MKTCKSCAWAALVGAIGAGAIFMSPDTEARPSEAAAVASTFELDSVHSMIVFRIKHMGVSYTYGTIHMPEGSYSLDFDTPSNSTLEVTAKVENIDTGNDGRDKHLKSPDFFSSRQFPEISFVGKSFEKIADGEMLVTGELTMLGKVNPVEAHITWVGDAQTPQGHKSGFEAEFKIERSKWGMTKYLENDSLGDEVTLYVTVEGRAG